MFKQIKNFPTRTIAASGDLLIMQDGTTGQTFNISKASLLAGLSGDGSSAPGGGTGTNLAFVSNGDSNGLFYFIGTNSRSIAWVNPAGNSLTITASSIASGSLISLTNRQNSDFLTNSVANSWVKFQVAGKLKCNYYSIRTRAANVDYYPRNWILQGSNNGADWIDLNIQVNNTTLSSVGQWLSLPVVTNVSYSSFRILQNGLNSSNSHFFCLDEIELYGLYEA